MTFPKGLRDSLHESIVQSVKQALEEDIGSGDLTAALVDEDSITQASIIARESAVFCGQAWAKEVFLQLDPSVTIVWHVNDGDAINQNQTLCDIKGSSRSILSGERTALNFLQTLSGTATLTHRYVDAIEGTETQILDTRKTIPGLRLAQKYAVKCGGGENHRIGLYDGVLIKENHIQACGSLENAIAKVLSVTSIKPDGLIEMEVETLQQLQAAVKSGVKRVLLDNMTLDELRQAVVIANKAVELEASGGITLENVRAIAETGVDYISIGDITKNIRAVDLSLRFA